MNQSISRKKTRLQSSAAGLRGTAKINFLSKKFSVAVAHGHRKKMSHGDRKPQYDSKSSLKNGRMGVRFCCSGAKSTSIHLIKGPSMCPKSEGATKKIRPRMRNPRDHDPIGAVSRVSWTGVFLASEGGHPERNFH
jgi:hypothetical protein